MLIDENPLITRSIDSMLAAMRDMKKGDFMSYETIERATGLHREHENWSGFIVRFRRTLLEKRSVALRPVKDAGYRMLTDEEQVVVCARDRQKKMRRQSIKAIKEIRGANTARLSLHAMRLQTLQLEALKKERKALSVSIRQTYDELPKSETLPTRA